MAVLEFSFEDREQGWRLEPVRFGELNLLVGRSGAGKTRILRALYALSLVAGGATFSAFDCRWSITLKTSEGTRTWEGETRRRPDPDAVAAVLSDQQPEAPEIHSETIRAGEDVLLARGSSFIQREGGPTLPVGLEPTSSVLHLLSKDPVVMPVVEALRGVRWSSVEASALKQAVNRSRLATLRASPHPPNQGKGRPGPGLTLGALLLQEGAPEQFKQIVDAFIEIFPDVEALRVDLAERLGATPSTISSNDAEAAVLDIAFKERGVSTWVRSGAMSSGMRRTLRHLLELALYPGGTTLLVDEYENSLGVNCLGPLTDHLLREHRGIQFILTSHHPYVIHNIPWEYWKIVTSHGSVVRVRDFKDFPELVTRSKHDRFQLLLSALDADEESAG